MWKATASTFLFNTTTLMWQRGPALPTRRLNHCVVNINGTSSFVAGGFGGDPPRDLDDAYLYHWPIDQWVELPRMMKRREGIACAAYKSKPTEQQQQQQQLQQHILVVGGKKLIFNFHQIKTENMELVWLFHLLENNYSLEGGIFSSF